MKYILMSLVSFMFTFSVFSKEFVVDMLNKRVSVALGDTVKWLPTEAGHNVEFVSGPEGVELPPKSYINKEFSMKFETPGIYLYVCSPHSIMGMIGLVIVGDDTSNKDAILAYDIGGRANKKLKALLSEL